VGDVAQAGSPPTEAPTADTAEPGRMPSAVPAVYGTSRTAVSPAA
jgi:hypothetical protein